MATYYKDGKTYTESEIKALNPNTSFPIPFKADGYELVFDTPSPTVTELQVAYQDGTEIDSKGNRVVKWGVRDMFDTPEEEAEYLANKAKSLVPTMLTPRQIRMVLTANNMRQAVEDAVAASTDYNLKDWWEYSLEYKRDNELLIGMATTLGLTDEQVDAMFVQGANL